MKERLTTFERREEIRALLVKEKSTTSTFLMNHYGVSRKTIYNDILFLNSIMPLETYRGNGGGIFLKMEYDAPKVYLTTEEENLLLNVLDSLSVKEKKLMINIINKFSMPDNMQIEPYNM